MAINTPIRWVGGKRKLLSSILPKIPQFDGSFYEPFMGGASVSFAFGHERTVISDMNEELVLFFQELQETPDKIWEFWNSHQKNEETYYEVRSLDRDVSFKDLPRWMRAGRFLFLNKLCFNGIWRVNSKHGYNNVPFGHTRPKLEFSDLKDVSEYLSKNCTIILSSYEKMLDMTRDGDFVYLDPPYVPLSATESFVGYTSDGFSLDEQRKLRDECLKLSEKNVKFIQSNSSAPLVYELYSDFTVETVEVRRTVGAQKHSRKSVNEVLIRNF